MCLFQLSALDYATNLDLQYLGLDNIIQLLNFTVGFSCNAAKKSSDNKNDKLEAEKWDFTGKTLLKN